MFWANLTLGGGSHVIGLAEGNSCPMPLKKPPFILAPVQDVVTVGKTQARRQTGLGLVGIAARPRLSYHVVP